MYETQKNFDYRIKKGDFDKYLHGRGIDIGGGPDCLKLPPNIPGEVKLWDLYNGDAQYLHGIKDEAFDFVYSSHCLEHMRDIHSALMNWIRITKKGGYLYICVPHETWYEKGIWPSRHNPDHKHSFTISEKSNMPANIVLKDLLALYSQYVEVVDIRENLRNYDFNLDPAIDQTHGDACAQIDFILRKKENAHIGAVWHITNYCKWVYSDIFTTGKLVRKYRKMIDRYRNAIDPMVKENAGVVLYGAGKAGWGVMKYCKDFALDSDIIAVCDSDEKKVGRQIWGKTIISIDDALKAYSSAYFIIADVNNYTEMKNYLLNKGVSGDKCIVINWVYE